MQLTFKCVTCGNAAGIYTKDPKNVDPKKYRFNECPRCKNIFCNTCFGESGACPDCARIIAFEEEKASAEQRISREAEAAKASAKEKPPREAKKKKADTAKKKKQR